jgi:periplasmic divalent cation tolerance protein
MAQQGRIMDDTSGLLIWTNLPDRQSAETLAHHLLERRLAACVNILPAVLSIYRWQGAIEEAAEVGVMIKTTARRYDALQQAIVTTHPYEVPEIIAIPIHAALPAYLAWLQAETNEDEDDSK